MLGYVEVTTADGLNAFESVVDGFIDASVREVRLIDRRSPLGGFDAQILVTCPSRNHDVELVLCGVGSFEVWSGPYEDGIACSIAETGGWPPLAIRIGDVKAAQLFYRVHVDRAAGAVLGPEPPSPTAVPAEGLQDGWRQCSQCCDAWKEPDSRRYARCPFCGVLTELVSPG